MEQPSEKSLEKIRKFVTMQIYKYCHCLLFVRDDGLPITEYLPENHEGKQTYGTITDPTPERGRPLRHLAKKS